jgi:hypothetical protein
MEKKKRAGLIGQLGIEVEMLQSALDRSKGLLDELVKETPEPITLGDYFDDFHDHDMHEEVVGTVASDGTGPNGVTLFEPRPSKKSYNKYPKYMDWGYLIGYSNKIGIHENIFIDILELKKYGATFNKRNVNAIMRKYTGGPYKYLQALSYAYIKTLKAMGTIEDDGRGKYRFRL